MASNKNAKGICDVCGWTYRLRELKKNSYGLLVCPIDFEGAYDLTNHPQNFSADVRDDISLKDPRPDSFAERMAQWQNINRNWEDITEDWNTL